MKNIYFMLFFSLLTIAAMGQDEEPIPGALIGSCAEPDSNKITIFFDYSKNCPEADPTGVLAGVEELGFHSGANSWAVIVPFDDPSAITMEHLGNGIYKVDINTVEYYGLEFNDIENIRFVLRSSNPSDSWDAGGRDDVGGGGFGEDEPCNDFELNFGNLPICSEQVAESSVSLFGPITAASSCINTEEGTVTIEFDNSLNCPEADPNNVLAGASALGFHSGANDWASTVEWDADGAMQATNNSNDIFSVTIDPMEYYGVALEDLENILMIMNNGIANPSAPWDAAGRDDRDGGFGGAEPCSDLVFLVSEAPACIVEPETISSDAVLASTGDNTSCIDAGTGKVRIAFDNSLNCPEADPEGKLAGAAGLGFHSGANDWAESVDWNAEGAAVANNAGDDIFTVTLDIMEYYGIAFDSLRNIKFVLNNGIANENDPWTATGRDDRNGGFGGDEPCSDLVFDITEMPTCDLAEVRGSSELTSGLAMSCVDRTNGRIRIDFDRNQNCIDADPENMLAETIGFHSGVNNWQNQVAWDADGAMSPTNDGNGLYSMVIDVQEYYGVPIDSLMEVNFLYNNGIASPDDPWTITGKSNASGGGFGGEDPCSNFLFVTSEVPACNLPDQLSTQELFSGLASSCVDAANGKVRIDFDRSLNCVDADPNNLLGDTIGFHSGINTWSTQVAWDADGAMSPTNDGNGLYSMVIDVQEYYGMPLDSITEINFLYNNGVNMPEDAWTVTGKATTGGGGFGGDESCDNFLFVLSEAPTCDLSGKVISSALVSGLASSCVDSNNGKIRLDFDMNLNCSEADPGDLLVDLPQIGFHSGINGWAIQKPWDDEGAIPAVNDGNNLFTVIIDAIEYYGVEMSEIDEINFLYNNGFTEGADPWANTGKDETGMGGFGGDELCDNLLFIPSNAETCDLSTNTIDLTLKNSILVMPNPFSEQVLIQFDNPSNKEYELIINDLSGKVVRQLIGLTGNQVTLEKGNLVAGMYFMQLFDKDGNIATSKLMVK